MVRRLFQGTHQCVVYNRSAHAVAELVKEKAVGYHRLVKKLTRPRAVWLMVPRPVWWTMSSPIFRRISSVTTS
jgi:6-phosphogluconate dehydrogenase